MHVGATGKGRGRQVIAVARTADVILMMLDAGKGDVQRRLLEKELESVGIRLNKKPPNIYFKVQGNAERNLNCLNVPPSLPPQYHGVHQAFHIIVPCLDPP